MCSIVSPHPAPLLSKPIILQFLFRTVSDHGLVSFLNNPYKTFFDGHLQLARGHLVDLSHQEVLAVLVPQIHLYFLYVRVFQCLLCPHLPQEVPVAHLNLEAPKMVEKGNITCSMYFQLITTILTSHR